MGCPSRYTAAPNQKPQGRHATSPSPPVELGPLGRLKWHLQPPWAFFDPQRAEGEAGRFRAAAFLEPQCHQAESFSALAFRPCAWGARRAGRPAVVRRVGLGHGEPTGPRTGRQAGRQHPSREASEATEAAQAAWLAHLAAPGSPGAVGGVASAAAMSQHKPGTLPAPSPGRLAHGRRPSSPSLRAGGGGPVRRPGSPARTRGPRSQAPRRRGKRGEVAGALNEVAFSSPAGAFPGSLRRDPDREESRRAGARTGTLQ